MPLCCFRPPDHAFSALTSDANNSAAWRWLPGMTWAYTCNVMHTRGVPALL